MEKLPFPFENRVCFTSDPTNGLSLLSLMGQSNKTGHWNSTTRLHVASCSRKTCLFRTFDPMITHFMREKMLADVCYWLIWLLMKRMTFTSTIKKTHNNLMSYWFIQSRLWRKGLAIHLMLYHGSIGFPIFFTFPVKWVNSPWLSTDLLR